MKEFNKISVPVVCTRGVIVFPNNDMTIEVGRPKSLNAIEEAKQGFDSHVLIVSQIDPLIDVCKTTDLYHVGTLCTIKHIKKRDDIGARVTFRGLERARILEIVENEQMFFATIELVMDEIGDSKEEMAVVRQIAKTIESFSGALPNVPPEVINHLSKGVSAPQLADSFAHYFPLTIEKKQTLLETFEVNQRLLMILEEIEEEKIISNIENDINRKVKEKIDEGQKEYYLREKLRAIKEELGDTPSREDDTDNLRKMIEENPYPKHVKEKALEELRRYEMMPSASSEASVIRNYLDWLLKTPWYQETVDNEDLTICESILNEDHYGLEKVKERILEYLAVKQMTNSLNAPILCLAGPPGVGKTSLAKSIARALNREFVKMSLGGVKDESEIRGHRRTYLGSMPGRIIQGMKKAQVINPVFLIDEIDKMASDYKGDPSSAMLEVLDPEQNTFFSDHYLEESYDLSKVLFIATANYLENIPAALKDRLEIIQLSSYTENEKVMIAKKHLVPKQLKLHGLKKSQFSISDKDILYLIKYYTRESGVRQLERVISALCRKTVLAILKDNQEKVKVNKEIINKYLGKEKYDFGKKETKNQVGVVTGLAYTQFGGDILPIEVTYFNGKGNLIVTGQLGDVMKESASIALGYVKANAEKLKIDPIIFEKKDIHIHAPEGAVPKDGPSAGITITTALVSALSNTKVKASVAMTGEITLRGNVLPIGGLKEKSLAAHRSGIKTIIIPKENEKDLDEIDAKVREQLTIIPVEKIEQVLEIALDHEN